MHLSETTHKHQSDLAAFCRTGIYKPIPGVIKENVRKYRELVYNVVDDSLQSAYPLTFNLFDKSEWDKLVHDFFSSHHCQSPQIWKMPKELIDYVKEFEKTHLNTYPFLIDLLLFEWMEVEVYMMEDIEVNSGMPIGSIKSENLILNPEIKVLALQYPVHLKKANEIKPEDKGQYFVSMHRDPETGRVHFTDMQYPHVEVIEILSLQPHDFHVLLEIFLKYAPFKEASEALTIFLEDSLKSNLLLGFEITNQN